MVLLLCARLGLHPAAHFLPTTDTIHEHASLLNDSCVTTLPLPLSILPSRRHEKRTLPADAYEHILSSDTLNGLKTSGNGTSIARLRRNLAYLWRRDLRLRCYGYECMSGCTG